MHSRMPLPWFAAPTPPLFLAPMSGFTGSAFRALCRAAGADVVVTEFVQSEALRRDVVRAWRDIAFDAGDRPTGIQIFGASPPSMAAAAALLAERLRPDFIDINYGCPAHNVVEHNAGARLMQTPALAAEIASAVVAAAGAFGVPVTAKIRLGWDARSRNAVEFAQMLADAGVAAVTVHGRTRAQGYSGVADWEEIGRVAAALAPLPVVGNGDLRDAAGALRRWRESGVAGLMVGRAALGNPWLFGEIKAALRGLPPPAPPTVAERWDALENYAAALVRGAPDKSNIRWLLPRLIPFTQNLAGARKLRARLARCSTLADLSSEIAAARAGTTGDDAAEPATAGAAGNLPA